MGACISLDFHVPLGSIRLALSGLLPLVPWLGSRGICMSASSDPEVVELSLQLSGLQITVRGPPVAASEFIQGLQRGSAQHSAASTSGYNSPRATLGRGEAASPAPSPAPSAATSGETRASILATFPDCPAPWISIASRELGASSRTPADRARRAWVAGNWAQAVVQGRVSSPNRSETIDLPNRFWCVVRCERCTTPRVFTTSAAFFRAVGSLQGSDTICHAFPSKTEAKIYLQAAGCEFPELD